MPYLGRPDLFEIFGIRGGREVWDDVTTPQRLRTNRRNQLNNQIEMLNQYILKTLDLSLIGKYIDSFETGNTYPVIGIDECLRIVGSSIDINNPENSNLTIDDRFKSGTNYQVESHAARRVIELESELNHERVRGNRIRRELTQKTNELQRIVDELDINQTPVMEVTLVDINETIRELREGIDGIPIYTLGTANNYGLMSKEDKQKLDTMIIPDYTEKINHINVTLNDLTQKIVTLKEPESSESE